MPDAALLPATDLPLAGQRWGDALFIIVNLALSLFRRVWGTVNVTQYTVHSHYKQKQLLGEILPQPCIHQLA